MAAKPYYTSNDIVESIKARASLPISQNTFTYNDFMRFINEELMLNAVPTLIIEHQEYLVFKTIVPLVNGISRYPIPSRAIGMALRDVAWSDTSGNFFKMTRIAEEDKAYFQRNVGSNQAIGKYYIEGNEIVLTPQTMTGATGNINFFFFLRPNTLVRDDRACIIESFKKDIVLANNSMVSGDTVTITIGNQTQAPTITTFTATTGTPIGNEFLIGATANDTANNLNIAINAAGIDEVTSTIVANTISITYTDITSTFTTSTATSFTIDNTYTYINFDQLESSYTDPETDVIEPIFYASGKKVDFLQTNPGHRTYTYDIKIKGISGNTGKFKTTDLKGYLNNSSGGQLSFLSIEVGDYICLANECIIPQIPPELHNALAERAASRILMALGDQQGLTNSQQKIAEMDRKQETLIGSRVEGSVNKVFNSMSLLRLGKRGTRRI